MTMSEGIQIPNPDQNLGHGSLHTAHLLLSMSALFPNNILLTLSKVCCLQIQFLILLKDDSFVT